ncbi:MAG: nuclear transport factor 2 family protein [Holophagaceae bacterium]
MTTLDPMFRSVLDAYFAAVNARDEVAMMGLLAPEPVYFGSLGGVTLSGRDPLVGVLRAVGGRWADFRQTPGPTYGHGPEVAMIGVLSADGYEMPTCWVFRFDPAGRLARVSTLFDPEPFLRHRVGADPLGPRVEDAAGPAAAALAVLDAYFETFNAGDEEAHLRLFHPEAAFHGSMTRLDTTGLATIRGVHRAAKETMKVDRLEVRMTYGRRTELAARVAFSPQGHEGQPLEGVWALRLDPAGLIERISILWNPSTLARPARA